MRPRLFYVTFKHEEGANALFNKGKGIIKLMDFEIPIRQAKEPTNFYWHNVQVSDGWRYLRAALVILIMICFFIGFFLIAMAAIKQKLLI